MNKPKNMESKMNCHRASADQWAMTEKWAADCSYESRLIDLRNRLEALEAKQREAAMNELRAASAEARPATFDEDENDRRFERAKAIIDKLTPAPVDSLVERVMDAGGMGLPENTRAAIRAVAAWLRDRGFTWVAQTLEKEADRD